MDTPVPETPRQIPAELKELQYCKDPCEYGHYLKGLRRKNHDDVYKYTSWVGNLLLQNFQSNDLQQGDGSVSSGITTRSMSAAALKAIEEGKVTTRAMTERARGPITSKVIPVASKPPLPSKKIKNKKAPSSSSQQLDPPPEPIPQPLANAINPNPDSETGKNKGKGKCKGKRGPNSNPSEADIEPREIEDRDEIELQPNNEAEVQEFGFNDEQGMIQHEVSATPSSFESSLRSEREGAGDDPELFGGGDPDLFVAVDPEFNFSDLEADPTPGSEFDQMHEQRVLKARKFEKEINKLYKFFTMWCKNFKTTVRSFDLKIKKLYERKMGAIRKYSLEEGPQDRADAIVRMMESKSKQFSALILYLYSSFLSHNSDPQTECEESEKLIENPSLIRDKFNNQNDAFCRFGDAMSLELEIKVSDFMVAGKNEILLKAALMRQRIRELMDKIRESYADFERKLCERGLPELVELAKSDSAKYQNETERLYDRIFKERCAQPVQEKEVIALQKCKSSMDAGCNHFFSDIYRTRCFKIFKDSEGLSELHNHITGLQDKAIAEFTGKTDSSQLIQQFIQDIQQHKDSVINLSLEMFLATQK